MLYVHEKRLSSEKFIAWFLLGRDGRKDVRVTNSVGKEKPSEEWLGYKVTPKGGCRLYSIDGLRIIH